ncbi:MAG: hypothetical protein H6R17_3877 [Proteobacteria bacterium]|nr:hypothetical protein [Pseudomonadota bacterium]
MTAASDPAFRQLTVASLVRAWRRGWALFSRSRNLSVSYAMIFSLIGVVILVGIERASYAPLMLQLGGGLLLVGPTLLCGFFALADRVTRGEGCSLSDIVSGCCRTSPAMFAVALVSSVLFTVWMADVATLYGLTVGRVPMSPGMLVPLAENVSSFLIWGSLLALALPLMIFAISAFSVPLLYYRRASLWPALRLSVSAVLNNLAVSAVWTVLLSFCIVVSIVIFPLILLSFPVLAFASHSLYRELFPE